MFTEEGLNPITWNLNLCFQNLRAFSCATPQPAGGTVGTIPAGSAVNPSRLRAVLGLAPRFWNQKIFQI